MKRGPGILVVGLLIALGIMFLMPEQSEGPEDRSENAIEQPSTQSRKATREEPKPRPQKTAPKQSQVPTLSDEETSIKGIVVDRQGFPRPHLRLKMVVYKLGRPSVRFSWSAPRFFTPDHRVIRIAEVESDQLGYFRLPHFDSRHGADLVIKHPSFANTRVKELHQLSPDQTKHLEVVVAEAASVSGQVNTHFWPEATGVKVAGIHGHRFAQQTLIGEDGQYHFPTLPPGTYRVSLALPRGLKLGARKNQFFQDVTLIEGDKRTVDFGFDRLVSLNGRALVDNIPPSYPDIFLVPAEGNKKVEVQERQVDEEGYFTFEDLPPGSYTLVLPQTDIRGKHFTDFLKNEPSRVELTLQEDLNKIFHFPAYSAVQGVLKNPERWASLSLAPIAKFPSTRALPIQPKSDGSFYRDGLAPGQYRLYGESRKQTHRLFTKADANLLEQQVEIPAGGGVVDLGDVGLEATANLSITVELLEEDEMTGQLSLWGKGDSKDVLLARRQIQGKGEIFIENLPVGLARLTLIRLKDIYRTHVVPNIVDLKPGQTARVTIMERPTTVLYVTSPKDDPEWKTLVIVNADGERFSFEKVKHFDSVDRGSKKPILYFSNNFAVARNLPEGNYQVYAYAENEMAASYPVVLENGETFLELRF